MECRKETANFCGNILVRRTKRRSFLAKSLFEGVFGVLTESSFEYYQSSAQWTNSENPQFSVKVLNIQSVEEVDDEAFAQSLCFQLTYPNRTKKDNNNTRTLYLAAYDVEELHLWLASIRLACKDNPVFMTNYHPGRFTGKWWTCCRAASFRNTQGCKTCTIHGIPELKKQKKLSQAIAFRGFGVIAHTSHLPDLPESLPFESGDHLTVSDASGKYEWKAFSTTSTSGYGFIPKDHVRLKDLEEEPWFFGEIPTSITTAILRDQVPGCFLMRTSGFGSKRLLSFRTDRAVKHVEVLLDASTQTFSVKDESDAVSYANFLQFDSIQQLLDQCKQHPTLGTTLEKYPPVKNADEIWKLDWEDFQTQSKQISSGLPWSVLCGKFHNHHVLAHVLPEGSSDLLKEKFCNQSRLLMTLNHDNVIKLVGVGRTGPRNFMIQEDLPNGSRVFQYTQVESNGTALYHWCFIGSPGTNGDLEDYLRRNSSLLLTQTAELVSIMKHVVNGMVYLSESGIVHNELVACNCLVAEKGIIKISGFHCARSSWCIRPLTTDEYKTKVPIQAPELTANYNARGAKSDVWAYGLLLYVVVTAGQSPILTLEQVLKWESKDELMEQIGGFNFLEAISLCLQNDPKARPTFYDLRAQISLSSASSTPSCSSFSLEGSLSPTEETAAISTSEVLPRRTRESLGFLEVNTPGLEWDSSDIDSSHSTEELKHRLRDAELTALKAKALQKRAEAEKDAILNKVHQAETKCLKEVEMMTKTFLMRLNEANDRAAEAEQARYLAQEVKRLTEEKYTLYKYESEKSMHDLKSMFDDALLERDELVSALKTVGKDFDAHELISPKRRDSVRNLEDKYQRYISTSDRTIQSLKTQLNSVVQQRDQIASDRESAKNEVKETREALEQAIKDKEEVRLRLEEAHFEIERLEEMISTMTQKRQQAERERDQLQMLTDMSLMKLRHAESGIPKKRISLCSFPPKMDDRPKEKRDPNLRRLSEHLLHLLAPTPRQRSSKYDESDLCESSEEAISEGTFSSSRLSDDDQTPELPRRRTGGVRIPQLQRDSQEMEPSVERPFRENIGAVGEHKVTETVIRPSSPHRFIHINYFQPTGNEEKKENGRRQKSTPNGHVGEAVQNRGHGQSKTEQSIKDARRFTIPTLHIEEADTDPEGEYMSDGNESAALEQQLVFEDTEGRPMFIIGDQNGQTKVVYSFDDLSELLDGIPQTTL